MNSWRLKKDNQQTSSKGQDSDGLQKSPISLVALSQHKGVSVSSELTPKLDRIRSSFVALNLNEQFQRHQEITNTSAVRNGSKNDATMAAAESNTNAGGWKLGAAPSKSLRSLDFPSKPDDTNCSFTSFSSVVSPSVFQLIPELQRGQSSYCIDYSESSFSTDIDYFWSVVPSAQSLTETVKATLLDTYTDSSLPTVLQPRFKPKAPGTALALWLPNIMASVAKRFTDESPPDFLPPGGDKNKDIVKQNIGVLLKRDFTAVNWPFKTHQTRQSDGSALSDHQRTRRKVGGITNHRTKVKHLRGGESTCTDKLDKSATHGSEHSKSNMAEKSSWRGPWRKPRIKYIECDHGKQSDTLVLEEYDTTPGISRRRRLGRSVDFDADSEKSSSNELTAPDVGYSPVFDDDDDNDESVTFFNYSNDGSSYSCTLSPIHTLSGTETCNKDVMLENTIQTNSDSDSEDEEELFEESFRLETEHIDCECTKYAYVDEDDFPCLKTLEENDNREPSAPQIKIDDMNTQSAKDRVEHKANMGRKGKTKRIIPSSRQRRITDTGRIPPNSHREDTADDDNAGSATHQQTRNEKDMRDKIEYMRVASQEKVDISAKLYIRIPDKVHLCKVQTHLLLCAMKAFFTCTEGIQVRWVKSLHSKMYQLLQRDDTKIKFAADDDGDDNFRDNPNTVCLLLSHDASVLLRDRYSTLLTSIADILQIKTDNLLVLEQDTPIPPPRKSKTRKKSSSEFNGNRDYSDMQTEWFLPVFM